MGKITLSKGGNFKVMSEGVHTLTVLDGSSINEWGKVVLKFENEAGEKHNEFYSLLDDKGETNTGALSAFSFTARVLLNDLDTNALEEIDVDDLVGKKMICEVEHTVGNNGKTYVKLNNKQVCVDDTPAATPEDNNGNDDLMSALGL